MASLTSREKRILEKLFGMESGYVLDFSNRTFAEFFADVVDLNIYSKDYDYSSGSKANRLRKFWTVEDDDVVAEVLAELITLADEDEDADPRLVDRSWDIVDRLRGSSKPVAAVRTGGPVAADDQTYEVALSFAGEQRSYVRDVAAVLKDAGVAVFFDEDVDLWGKDLAVELGEIYASRSRYVVVFVSEEYVSKSWTHHERQHALAGRLRRRDESVLPAKFDDTELPGLPSTIGYLDLRTMKPRELAARIIRKVKPRST